MKKSINNLMRSLHRDIGFLVLGLTIIYSVSGIVLIYRKSDFLKTEKKIEIQISPNLTKFELGTKLNISNLSVFKDEGDLLIFNTGHYNKLTGIAIYNEKSLPKIIKAFNKLHKTSNKSKVYWATTIYGVLLFLLAISSLWMLKPKSPQFKRGIILTITGLSIALLLLFF